MALFKRTPKEDPAARQRAAIDGFWSWWATEGRALATASTVGEVGTDQLAAALSGAVDAIHPDLEWETAAGTESRHLLTVTAAGVPELRPLARRWRLAAPPADAEWTYADLRLPVAGDVAATSLTVGDHSYVIGEASVDAHVRGLALDVSVHHPHFAVLTEDQRNLVSFLLLDQVLGEEAVETWVGQVTSSSMPALDPVPITGLRSVVAGLRAEHTEPDGSPKFVLLQGEAPNGHPVLVLARIPLRAATAPHLDTYVGIAVPYTDPTPEGLPGPGSLDRLRALEDHVTERIGSSGEIVAVQSHDGMRVLHAYVDGTTPAAEQIRVAVQGWDQGRVHLEVRPDPAWSAVAHLRG
jgi:Family of unknown function (DUF695)